MSCDSKALLYLLWIIFYVSFVQKRYFIDLKMMKTRKKTRSFLCIEKIEIDGTLSADPKPIAPEKTIDLLSFVLAHVCSKARALWGSAWRWITKRPRDLQESLTCEVINPISCVNNRPIFFGNLNYLNFDCGGTRINHNYVWLFLNRNDRAGQMICFPIHQPIRNVPKVKK